MKLIVITNPADLLAEHELINALFEEGLSCLHIRKPDHTLSDSEIFIKGIKPQFLRRLVIHQHYKLIGKYNLKGIHLKQNYFSSLEKEALKDLMKTAQKQRLTLSLSQHSMEAVVSLQEKFDYLMLSPVFESISKENYKPSENLLKLPSTLKTPVIALGGISAESVRMLEGSNYAGVAVLGEIWKQFAEDKDIEQGLQRFRNLKQVIEQIEWKQKDPIY
jgi:thiamine-phosphate pyrophosphorylase